MSPAYSLGWSVRVAVIAGVIYIPLGVFFLVSEQRGDNYRFPTDYVVEGLFAVALALTAVALVGFHVALSERFGRLGMVAVALAVAGHVAMAMSATASTIAGADTIDILIPLGFLGAMIGVIILGIATWRARIMPGWLSVLLMIAYPATIALGENGGVLVLGSVWIVVGYVLWSGKTQQVVQTESIDQQAVVDA